MGKIRFIIKGVQKEIQYYYIKQNTCLDNILVISKQYRKVSAFRYFS